MGFRKGERIISKYTLKEMIEKGFANEDGTLTKPGHTFCGGHHIDRRRKWRGKEFNDPAEYEYLLIGP